MSCRQLRLSSMSLNVRDVYDALLRAAVHHPAGRATVAAVRHELSRRKRVLYHDDRVRSRLDTLVDSGVASRTLVGRTYYAPTHQIPEWRSP